MRHSVIPAIIFLGAVVVLAACGPATTNTPVSPTPGETVTPSPDATVSPSPTTSP